MNRPTKKGIVFAILAAALYAINAPFSKILLNDMPPKLMAGFLYLGAGLGMLVIVGTRKLVKQPTKEVRVSRSSLPYIIAMIVLDITAPICLLTGLKSTTAANASLLNNFEIVATACIALLVFKEAIHLRLWLGIGFVTLACLLLSFDHICSLHFSMGSLFVLLACVCWGFENNCTKKLSSYDPLQIVLLKGIFSGLGSLLLGVMSGEGFPSLTFILFALLLGFIAYGLSIYTYIYAQRYIGAARTSAYYAIAPFIGTLFSLVLFRELPKVTFYVALAFMGIGAWLSSHDKQGN